MTLVLIFGSLAILYVYPAIMRFIVKPLKHKSMKIDLKRWLHLHPVPIFLTSILLHIGLWIIHILAVIKFIDYFNEIVDMDLYENNSLPTIHAVVSFLAIGCIYIVYIIVAIILIYKRDFYSLLAISITVNILHIGCYFMPYMLLAFIHNPLQTSFTYFTIAILIACIYLPVLSFWVMCSLAARKEKMQFLQGLKTLTSFMILSLIVYIFITINYVLTLGSFDDFKALNNLLLPLLIGLFSLFILRPAYKQCRKKLNHKNEKDDKNDNRKEEDTLHDVHINAQSNDDAHNETSM